MAKKCCYSKVLMKFFVGKRGWRQDKRTVKLDFLSFFLCKIAFLGHICIYFLKTRSLFWCLGHSSWSTFGFTPSERPKGFVNCFFQEIKLWKLEHGKRPYSMILLHGPWCKLTLILLSSQLITYYSIVNMKHIVDLNTIEIMEFQSKPIPMTLKCK